MGCIERKAGESRLEKVPLEGAQAEHEGKWLGGIEAVAEDPQGRSEAHRQAQGSRI